jgi:hypothetical protein
MLPIVISIIVLIAVLSTLFAFMRRQHSDNPSINNLDGRNSIPKSELSSEIFPLNDFVRSGSKPKIFESQSTQPNDIYGKTSAQFYATPNRKSIPQSMIRHLNSDHEYAEPHLATAQYSQPRCLFSDDNECANLSMCALMVPNTRL